MKVLRTGAILILLTVLMVVAGGAIGGRSGLKIALAIAVVMNFASYFFLMASMDNLPMPTQLLLI